MSGYLSDNVYDGKRPMSAAEVARRKELMKQTIEAAQRRAAQHRERVDAE